MTTLTVGGYSLGNLDGISGVAAAAQQYNDNRTTSNLINYRAALANAAASATSLIPGEGAAFAGNAIAANIKNLAQNHSTMSASDLESAAAAIAGALATLVGQGVEITGLAAANINPLVGGGVFTLGEFINAVGFVISAAGVIIDSGTIAQIATQSLQALGLAPNPSGQYSPVTLSSSNFICDATNAATMWNIVKGDNAEQINSAPSNNGGGLDISNSIGGDIIVAPGATGSPYTFSISGSDNNIMGINSTPITGSAVGVNVSGSENTINAGAGTSVSLSNTNGRFDVVNANGDQFNQGGGISLASNTQANVNGSGNGISVANGDSMGAYGGGNTINATAGSVVAMSGTNGSYDTVNANGVAFGGTAANGQGTGIWLDSNVQANIGGNNNGISVAAGDSMGAYGGGNTINATAGSVVAMSGTSGFYDTVNANGVAFGGTAANGQGTGIWLDSNVQANIGGNNNGISVTAGDSMGANGGGNTINAAAGSVVAMFGTNGSFDTVNANGVAFGGTAANGQGTGIWLDSNVQVNVNGTGNGIGLNAGDSLGVYGGGNVINAAPITTTAINNTNGNADVVNATGDLFGAVTANGQGSGIWLGQDAQATVNGDGNGIGLTAGATLTATGNSDIVNMAAGSVVNVSGTGDEINGSNSIVNITGNNETIWLSGESNVVTVTGQNVTVYAQNSTVNFIGSAANNNNNKLIGVKNTGSGWSSNDAWYALTGLPHPIGATAPFQLPAFTNPGASVPGSNTSSISVPDAGSNLNPTDPGWVPFIPVPGQPPGFPNTPLIGEPISVTAPPGAGNEDPIIFNLNGNKVQTTSLEGSATYFDMENNGQKTQTSWGTAGEGYLVYDPNDVNNTEMITQDAQLVGGFGALQALAQQFDGTGHGDLTAADALWTSLKVWVDTTGDGHFQSGQLMTLDQLGITSIDLDGSQINQNNNGNTIITDSSFSRIDGSRGDVAGVDLNFERSDTQNLVNAQVQNLVSVMASVGAPPVSATSTIHLNRDNFPALTSPSH
ncbi:S-layer family protein [Burkholderia sp. Ap-962]|uniref:beta strand repeat-containing protein n=1 Tax=Burkholderia sp. Ap-962 TaxID=2608333 RepID=UPI001422A8D6|nr:S-layer family protein [Burkholderia sp. Ap-962]NIF69884.1 S-layer family protein [Burkholderia sp. Ap-962]